MRKENIDEEFYRIQDEYFERFNDTFPTYCVRYLSIEEIIKLIQKCLDENKPTDLCSEEDVDY